MSNVRFSLTQITRTKERRMRDLNRQNGRENETDASPTNEADANNREGADDLRFDLELPDSIVTPQDGKTLIGLQFIYSLLGLIFGFGCVVVGAYLFVQGISGGSSLLAEVTGLKLNISDAAPGALLFCVGIMIAWITRFNVKITKR